MIKAFRTLHQYERSVFTVLIVLFLGSGLVLYQKFYNENTVKVPARGGTYIEGSVGELNVLLPWFTVTNDVNRDIVSLVFSGLLKYNPHTQAIEDDLATLEVSADNRIYTVTLKDDLYWHDSTDEAPHPITADDVVYTYSVIQAEAFPNPILKQNFLGVTIDKLSEKSVRFTLVEPYRFFPSNLTLGLVPERSFLGVPPDKLDQALDFAFNPIGSGPYALHSVVQTELSTEVTLERFYRPIDRYYHLEQVVFRVFPDYSTLLADIRNLDGVRLVPRNEQDEPIVPRSFATQQYILPQYVALFLNVERPILQDEKLRLGLQLGTNKQELVDTIGESVIIDTPLLEITDDDWRYAFDPEAARGAFFESNWHLPAKIRLQRLLEVRDANQVGKLQTNPIAYLDTGAVLIITGSYLDVKDGATINGLPIQPTSETGTWIVALPTTGGTGSIALGMNALRLLNKYGNPIDSFYLWRTANSRQFRKADEEQGLVDLFLKSKTDALPLEERVYVEDMYLEKGLLRLRKKTDPDDIRMNNQGDRLSLTLLTSNSPPQYRQIATLIRDQWAKLGVHVGIDIAPDRQTFEEKLINRDYDILLYGQSLLDNLDSYPYWHSSGIQKFTDKRSDLRIDAYNLSQYSSLQVDSLLERIRKTSREIEQQQSLAELKDLLKADVPAIVLYSPLYTFAYLKDIQGIELGKPSLHSDRLLTLYRWYLKTDQEFKADKSWVSFFPWLLGMDD